MAGLSDCIYCGAGAGSREHIFPSALGGRRLDTRILCAPCNQGFSALDGLLENQLSLFNGLIGVRADRANTPKPASIESKDGPLLVDPRGTPTFVGPKVEREEVMPDGRRKVSIRFGHERQVQKFLAGARKQGKDIKLGTRTEGVRYLSEHLVSVQWSFGGTMAFREIGRIALNFLAHRWPDAARHQALRPFKDFIIGRTALSETEQPVWYAGPGLFPLPDPASTFGHQILLVISPESNAYARVRLFSTFDLVVDFGCLQGIPMGAVMFDIDPLAEHHPNDLQETPLPPERFPRALDRAPKDAEPTVATFLDKQMRTLLRRIDDRQWQLKTEGLLLGLNALRDISPELRIARVLEILQPHKGLVLSLLRHAADLAGDIPDEEARQCIQGALEYLLTTDPDSSDGLSHLARLTLDRSFRTLAEHLTAELTDTALTDERLQLLLAGGVGAGVVVRPLIEQILEALKPSEEDEEGT